VADAMDCDRQALRIEPDSAETHNSMGTALKDLGQLQEAVATYRRAVALKPNCADAHFSLGFALMGPRQFYDAVITYQFGVRGKALR